MDMDELTDKISGAYLVQQIFTKHTAYFIYLLPLNYIIIIEYENKLNTYYKANLYYMFCYN